jgi:hypothetical protein
LQISGTVERGVTRVVATRRHVTTEPRQGPIIMQRSGPNPHLVRPAGAAADEAALGRIGRYLEASVLVEGVILHCTYRVLPAEVCRTTAMSGAGMDDGVVLSTITFRRSPRPRDTYRCEQLTNVDS